MTYDLSASPALVVIDVQEEYFDPSGPAYVEEAALKLPAINDLVSAFHEAELPVILVRHAHRPDGSDLGRMDDFSGDGGGNAFVEGTARVNFHSGLVRSGAEPVVAKVRYDSFESTDLDRILRTLRVDTVVLVGFMTSFCCASTARSAHARDYAVVFVPDGIGGPDLVRLDGSTYPASKVLEDTAAMLAAGFAEVVPAAEVLARLKARRA